MGAFGVRARTRVGYPQATHVGRLRSDHVGRLRSERAAQQNAAGLAVGSRAHRTQTDAGAGVFSA